MKTFGKYLVVLGFIVFMGGIGYGETTESFWDLILGLSFGIPASACLVLIGLRLIKKANSNPGRYSDDNTPLHKKFPVAQRTPTA